MHKSLVILVIVFAATAASALDPVNTGRDRAAIKGYDPVAYFLDGGPVKGSPDLTHEWNGAVWRFSTPEHLEMFKASPEHFAPKYGGYCAWAVSRGDTADIDPKAWKIVDGSLYLNYSVRIQQRWERDIPGHIAAADEQWPKLLARD